MTCAKAIEDSLEMLINTSGHFCWQINKYMITSPNVYTSNQGGR